MKVKLRARLLSAAGAYFNNSSNGREKRMSETKPQPFNGDGMATSAFLL